MLEEAAFYSIDMTCHFKQRPSLKITNRVRFDGVYYGKCVGSAWLAFGGHSRPLKLDSTFDLLLQRITNVLFGLAKRQVIQWTALC